MSRIPIAQLLLKTHRSYHDALTGSPFMTQFFDGTLPLDEYQRYLLSTQQDLGTVERLIEPSRSVLAQFNWASLDRRDALALDCACFELGTPSALTTVDETPQRHQPAWLRQHQEHYEALPPFLLVAHAIMYYFAAMFGGQKLRMRLAAMYGDKVTVHFYEFDDGALRDLMRACGEFESSLTDAQYEQLVAELVHAWHFQANLLGTKI